MLETERRDFWEICDRTLSGALHYGPDFCEATVWLSGSNEQIGDPTIADGILDRLVHNAHRMELRGESIRKTKTVRTEPEAENPSSP